MSPKRRAECHSPLVEAHVRLKAGSGEAGGSQAGKEFGFVVAGETYGVTECAIAGEERRGQSEERGDEKAFRPCGREKIADITDEVVMPRDDVGDDKRATGR